MSEQLGLTEEQLSNLREKMEKYEKEHSSPAIHFDDDKELDVDFLHVLENVFGKTAVAGFCKCRAFELLWNNPGDKSVYQYIEYLDKGGF